ncbi:dienelactone hydrolase family protein [Phenylobacterium sp.]|uniref:dienelactone hydrolase family protein n=1 Tax=Phenylobacterium sp. TaxID=1871053 RepID=UPI0025ED33D0|nr:dienelactone hydrolase family protein [Phenylobacterium sp.]
MPEARIEIETDDGCLDAFVACPEGPGRRPPVLLLGGREGLGAAVEAAASRLSAHGYFVLAPDWTARPAEDRREDADAWLDHLADERRVDDGRVAVLGHGAGADLALRVAAWRAERIAAVAAFGGRGLDATAAREIAWRINGLVHLGHALGVTPPRIGRLEAALTMAGVDFEVEIYEREPDWSQLFDLLARTIGPRRAASAHLTDDHLASYNL